VVASLGINTIINLIAEEKPSEEVKQLCKKHNIQLYHYGFLDKTACGIETFIKIQEIIGNPSNITLTHCVGGIGRTNMILGGYLIKQNNISPSEAIGILKKSRKVIMVPEQIMFLKNYYSNLLNTSTTKSSRPLPFKGLVLMMGLPCSGKSTLALEIFTKFSNMTNEIVHINQDELGKSACEELISSKAKSADLIILDRCNPISQDRIHWIQMYKQLVNSKVYLIFMNLGLDISLERVKIRKNHLTLGQTGVKIIIDMDKKMTVPDKKEGWDELIQKNSMEELEKFKIKIGLDAEKEEQKEQTNTNPNTIETDKIIKFPRTKHLANLGAMARDDLQMEKTDIETMLKSELTVEEKVDGANLGFRLDSDGKILVQNRSHYVTSSYHPQFKKLDQWVESKRSDLMGILSRGNYIIYGEWLYSKHSINYTKLPDYFIMFDLYDIDSGSFFSRDYVEKLLSNTSITLVPLIYRGKATLDKLKSLVQTESKFYPGVVEGVYIRCFEPNTNKLKLRGKIVRSDFICGDEHWTKGKITLNTIA
jgi:atypical dual specificity phosphatase